MVDHIITSEYEGNKVMRATYKSERKSINRNDDNCPILLEKMKFDLFSHYIPMKKSKHSGVYLSTASYGGIHSELTHI